MKYKLLYLIWIITYCYTVWFDICTTGTLRVVNPIQILGTLNIHTDAILSFDHDAGKQHWLLNIQSDLYIPQLEYIYIWLFFSAGVSNIWTHGEYGISIPIINNGLIHILSGHVIIRRQMIGTGTIKVS
jgi:hypothetical protein